MDLIKRNDGWIKRVLADPLMRTLRDPKQPCSLRGERDEDLSLLQHGGDRELLGSQRVEAEERELLRKVIRARTSRDYQRLEKLRAQHEAV